MKKINIIKKSNEFEELIKKGKYYNNNFFKIYIKKNNYNINRFGIAIPKRVGKAYKRNKLKRQLKNIIDSYIFYKEESDYVLIGKKAITNLNFQKMEDNLIKLLIKIENKEN